MAVKQYDLDQPMDKLIDLAVKKFGEVEFQDVNVGERTFKVLQIKKMQQYIDKLMDKSRNGQTIALPLWSKIWPGGLVMGHSLSSFPLPDGARVLEIGGGAILSAMVLADRGHDVVVTDSDPDALLFGRINALKNDLGDKVSAVYTDFSDAQNDRFDCIVGCEMLYDQPQFDLMADFIGDSLVEGEAGEVFLALELKRVAQNFFNKSNEIFKIMKSVAKFKDKDSGNEKEVNLFRFKRKES